MGSIYAGPPGTGNIWLDDVVCSSINVTRLVDCRHLTWGQNNCKHIEDISIVCYNKRTSKSGHIITAHKCIGETKFPKSCFMTVILIFSKTCNYWQKFYQHFKYHLMVIAAMVYIYRDDAQVFTIKTKKPKLSFKAVYSISMGQWNEYNSAQYTTNREKGDGYCCVSLIEK